MSHHGVNTLAHLTFITFNSDYVTTNPNGGDQIIRKIQGVGVAVRLYVIGYGQERKLELHERNCMNTSGVTINRFAIDDILNESLWGMLLLLFYVFMQTSRFPTVSSTGLYTVDCYLSIIHHMQQILHIGVIWQVTTKYPAFSIFILSL